MFEYAEDALETETPWERWEFRVKNAREWDFLDDNPSWGEDCEYRRKPKQNEIDTEAFNEWYKCSANGQHTYLSQAWYAALEWERSKK
jgi:hypothetical protein